MAVQSTSKAAFKKIAEELSEKRGKVFKAILELVSCCDFQIAERLHWPINCVTNRRGELVIMDYVAGNGVGEGPPVGNDVHFWKINEACLEDNFKAKLLKKPKKKKPKRQRKTKKTFGTQLAFGF